MTAVRPNRCETAPAQRGPFRGAAARPRARRQPKIVGNIGWAAAVMGVIPTVGGPTAKLNSGEVNTNGPVNVKCMPAVCSMNTCGMPGAVGMGVSRNGCAGRAKLKFIVVRLIVGGVKRDCGVKSDCGVTGRGAMLKFGVAAVIAGAMTGTNDEPTGRKKMDVVSRGSNR